MERSLRKWLLLHNWHVPGCGQEQGWLYKLELGLTRVLQIHGGEWAGNTLRLGARSQRGPCWSLCLLSSLPTSIRPALLVACFQPDHIWQVPMCSLVSLSLHVCTGHGCRSNGWNLLRQKTHSYGGDDRPLAQLIPMNTKPLSTQSGLTPQGSSAHSVLPLPPHPTSASPPLPSLLAMLPLPLKLLALTSSVLPRPCPF